MDRRKFIVTSVAGAAGLLLGKQLHAARKSKKNVKNYSVVILGDTHYDKAPATIYHSNYDDPNEKSNAVHRKEFERNGEMWADRCPRLIKRAQQLADDTTRLIYQTGDLVQGDCGRGDVHKQMLKDAIQDIAGGFPSHIPFVTIEGNHDVRGTQAAEVYHEFLPAFVSEELGRSISKTTFSFTIGDDAYIAVDFNHPDNQELDKLLKETQGARHTFILSHGTLFPADNSYPTWYFLGGRNPEKRRKEREYFRRELAKRNAICLCGHTHCTELLDWYCPEGRITQFVMNSVWANPAMSEYKELVSGPEMYGKFKNADKESLYADIIPGLKRFSIAYCAGSFKMKVEPNRIAVDFYGGDSIEPTKTFVLR